MLRPTNPTEDYLQSGGYTINSINAYKQQPQISTPTTPAPVAQTPQPKIETPPVDTNKIEIIQGDQIVQK